MNRNFIYFTSLPSINELLYIFATVHQKENNQISYHNLTIKKCRQLIFENIDVISCPFLKDLYGIQIVVTECSYKTGALLEYLKKHNLKPGPPSAVPKHVYEECCTYTIMAKLAPKWNLISNYLVYGKDFLVNNQPTDCVLLSIYINAKGDTTLDFKINRIKLPRMSLDTLEIPDSYLQELQINDKVQLNNNDCTTIRVLPSLNRGNIVSISRTLSTNGAIKSYQQMKRHWKNTYGYRLPESDSDLLYLEVSFWAGSEVFTYPSCCVRGPSEPVVMLRVDVAAVLATFMSDLLKTVPTVLGTRYPVPAAALAQLHLVPAHMSTISPTLHHKSALSQLVSQLGHTQNRPRPSHTQTQLPSHQPSALSQGLHSQMVFLNNTQLPASSKPLSKFTPNFIPKLPKNKPIPTPNNQQQTINTDELLETTQTHSLSSQQSVTGTDKIIPKFTPKLPKNKPTLTLGNQNHTINENKLMPKLLETTQASSLNSQQTVTGTNKLIPKFTPKLPKSKPTATLENQNHTFLKNKLMPKTSSIIQTPKSNDQQHTDSPKLTATTNRTDNFDHAVPKFLLPKHLQAPTPTSKKADKQSNLNTVSKQTCDESPKRSRKRAAAVAVSDVEMRAHLAAGRLHQLTVPTLALWLRRHGLRATTKDKKAHLLLTIEHTLTHSR